ncbi:TIGR02147 family protein [Bdellovibrio sp. KM01]|uniref:TIGR02147 family protein n=1 Tax=Bdellovibrio sp. KM01 TaxID=2748865 RepID=UPI0015E98483|nr:TIGR02147 family protein [Bdellovibrio sp. KM01]QLY26476.1 TIGR02147 family protein [Bdellovibrio sp. KM01]
MKTPDIFEFLNVHHFLEQIYVYRKSIESGFSYQRWADEMGIKDRSYLRQIVTGTRSVNSEMSEKLESNIRFTDLELQYFRALIEYSTADSKSQRDELGKKLVSLIKQKESV